MKLLVLEQNDTVSRIFKRIFDEKEYTAEFAKSEFECLEKLEDRFDYVVLGSSDFGFKTRIRGKRPDQKIFSLSEFMGSEELGELNERRDIIEKPFALLTMVGKLELEMAKKDF